MNRIYAVTAMALLIGGACRVAAQCDDPYDAVLCAYTLTPGEEAQFSHTDNQVSAFWADWAGKDFAELIAPDNCYPGRCGFVGTDDARMLMKAAASAKGLYLYFEVEDNVWVDRADASDIGADATDMFLDKMASEDIWDCTGCLIGLYSSHLTYTTNQFQIWFGATSPPNGLMFQAYDHNLWSWQAMGLTFHQAEVLMHMKVEVITLSATRKAQEWFFPWINLGTDGFDIGENIAGRKIGFTGGYNDKDGDNPDPHALRWTIKDPWVGVGEANYWGDILLSADLGLVEDPGDTRVIPGRRAEGIRGSASSAASYYTLKGARVPHGSLADVPAGSVLLKRTGRSTASTLQVLR